MNRIMNILLVMATLAVVSCQKPAPEQPVALDDPSDLNVEMVDQETVVLKWTDNASGEVGYRVFLRGEGDSYSVDPLESIAADATEYTFRGLTSGVEYDFGVQAVASDLRYHSKVVYYNNYVIPVPEEPEVPEDPADPTPDTPTPDEPNPDTPTPDDPTPDDPTPDVPEVDPQFVPTVTKIKTSYAYIAVSYKVEKITGANPEHGVCFSATGVPTVEDIKAYGPAISANKEILQVVPNAYLEDGVEYQMCVYIKDGSEYRYSEPKAVKLEAQPAAVELSWEKQNYASAEGVEIYKTTSQLNGRNFNAWYAIADPSKVDFKVLNTPTGKANTKTVSYQAENADGDCLVLINGGIFGNYHIGVIHVDGKPQEWVDFVYDKYWNPNGDGTSWYITRPIIGVDKSGKAAAYWTASPSVGTYYHYDRPLPTVPGEAAYPAATATYPVESINWTPYNALSTGPMVLYDGKCCVNHEKASSGAYMTNYECWALDIYEGNPDRTAVGVTEDGKIVLFICDGRIDQSKGATLEEVAMIMKSIGCVHAMNLDGGGSTGMWVKGSGMINYKDGSWRAVKSTLGFFTKE